MKKPYDIIVEHGIIEDIDFLVRKDVVSAIIEAMEEYAESVHVSRTLSDVRKLLEKAFKDGIHEANMGNIDYENGCSDGAAFQAWAKKNLPEHIR